MVVRLCEGQALDTEFEQMPSVNVGDYMDMVGKKTGALLEASMAFGGLLGRVGTRDMDLLRETGRCLGLAFQIQDDLLDLTAEESKWGKPVGADLISGKKSFLSVQALYHESTHGGSWFTEALRRGGLAAEAIPEARERLAEMGVLRQARDESARLYETVDQTMDALEQNISFPTVRWAIDKMRKRVL